MVPAPPAATLRRQILTAFSHALAAVPELAALGTTPEDFTLRWTGERLDAYTEAVDWQPAYRCHPTRPGPCDTPCLTPCPLVRQRMATASTEADVLLGDDYVGIVRDVLTEIAEGRLRPEDVEEVLASTLPGDEDEMTVTLLGMAAYLLTLCDRTIDEAAHRSGFSKTELVAELTGRP
ncbi:hypothetical protein DBP12_03405 [Streptomyces sp. CS014]|nr:hypothetical protein DBP12_03405 [Streptomyces sp. CS014]